MKYEPSLVVLAAGIGSRYGGLKQIDPVGPQGEIVLDYSVFDARAAGFKKIVFVIREELEQPLREHFSSVSGDLDLSYCVQQLDDLPDVFSVPEGRTKPWGTAHAVRAARDAVSEPFAVINADDFYGRQSFELIAAFLTEPPETAPPSYAMVAFELEKTLSAFGTVARGACTVDSDGKLIDVEEHTTIGRASDGTVRGTDSQGRQQRLQPSDVVSMNMWGFTPAIFDEIEDCFTKFLRNSGSDSKAEFYLPWVVDQLIKRNACTVDVLKTPEQWFGVTYKDDRNAVQKNIARLVSEGAYPNGLWS